MRTFALSIAAMICTTAIAEEPAKAKLTGSVVIPKDVATFEGLSMDDKKRIFNEFKDSLINSK